MKLEEEAKQVIDQIIFIGLKSELNRPELINMASKSQKDLQLFKGALFTWRSALCAQFDDLARQGGLERLKAKDNAHYRRLWKARFNREPQ